MPKSFKKDPIPIDMSREQLAQFWDTHSFADYWDALEPVQIRFTKPLSQGLTVRFDRQTLSELHKEAHKKGIGATTLIRMWVLESLDRRRKKAAA